MTHIIKQNPVTIKKKKKHELKNSKISKHNILLTGF